MEDLKRIFNRFTFFGIILGSTLTFFSLRNYYSNLYHTKTADMKLAARTYRSLAITFLDNWLPLSTMNSGDAVDMLADRMITATKVKAKIVNGHE